MCWALVIRLRHSCEFRHPLIHNLPSTGLGPLLIGPLSEVHGRNRIYQVSYFLFFAFSFPVAFAPHICRPPPSILLFFKL